MPTNKPRVMVVSDHSSLHTGFANVSRHILNHLYDTGKYEMAEFGWFAPRKSDVPKDMLPRWEVYVTNQTNADIALKDQYGVISLEGALVAFKPDVVISIGDEWMVNHIGPLRDKHDFVWIGYTPIDGMPHPPEWVKTFASMNLCVAYGRWGVNVMRQRNPQIQPAWIFHGVEADIYKPDPAGRKFAREAMNVKDDEWLIGYVGRNQPRKMIPVVFKAFAMWTKPHVWCPDTGKPWIVTRSEWYINELFHVVNDMPYAKLSRDTATKLISPFTGKMLVDMTKDEDEVARQLDNIICENPQAKLYLHCAINDVGWNINEQIARYKLNGRVILKDDLRVGRGVSDADLAKIYNAFDVFTLPTVGEGFGLPILEAMSCGIPIAVTDYSGHTEWCREAGVMLKPAVYFTETFSNIERAIVDNTEYVKALDHLYTDRQAYKRYAHNGRFVAERMDWKRNILPQWEILVDRAIAEKPARKPQVDTGAAKANVEIC